MLVEVVFAQPQQQTVVEVSLSAGACVQDALDSAAADPRLGGVNLAAFAVGIYGQICERDHHLKPGDRVEVYRELSVDAKTARRQRAQLQQQDRLSARRTKQEQ